MGVCVGQGDLRCGRGEKAVAADHDGAAAEDETLTLRLTLTVSNPSSGGRSATWRRPEPSAGGPADGVVVGGAGGARGAAVGLELAFSAEVGLSYRKRKDGSTLGVGNGPGDEGEAGPRRARTGAGTSRCARRRPTTCRARWRRARCRRRSGGGWRRWFQRPWAGEPLSAADAEADEGTVLEFAVTFGSGRRCRGDGGSPPPPTGPRRQEATTRPRPGR